MIRPAVVFVCLIIPRIEFEVLCHVSTDVLFGRVLISSMDLLSVCSIGCTRRNSLERDLGRSRGTDGTGEKRETRQ